MSRANERRQAIITTLMSEDGPVSGSALAQQLHASRQIIVQDITVLRAAGYDIISTHQGYIVKSTPLIERVFKVRHTSEQTREELSKIVALGGTVVDVFVWHKVYGKIEAKLNIFSEHGIDKYIEGIESGKSTELMNITSGYHYHTVRAESVDALDRIEAMLEAEGYIVPEN